MAPLRELLYKPLPSEPKANLDGSNTSFDDVKLEAPWLTDVIRNKALKKRRVITIISRLSIAFNLLAIVYLVIRSFDHSRVVWKGARPLYSPVDELAHEIVVSEDATETSPYHGPPTDEVDTWWSALYAPYLETAITAKEASLLANQTIRYPGTELFQTQVDVFHQLHCLDLVRKFIWPERYPETEANRYVISQGEVVSVADYCIQVLRESLTCSVPMAPVPWQFNPLTNRASVRFNGAHTCYDFSAVQDWARAHPPPLGGIVVDALDEPIPPELVPTRAQLVAAGWEE